MPKFRKKPIVVEARQFWEKDIGKFPEAKKVTQLYSGCVIYLISGLGSNQQMVDGDWIITGINGEKYSCKDDVFRKTYEAVEDTD